LVTGAGGVIGSYAAAEYATGAGSWTVVGVSRRRPAQVPVSNYSHIELDLLDREETFASLADIAPTVKRVVFAAYAHGGSLAAQVPPNVALLRNTLETLVHGGARLEHVTLYQGAKAYGVHLGSFKSPAKESDPRLMGPNFYYSQEDALRELADQAGFQFTVLRPDAVLGYAVGTAMNLLMCIAVYAAIGKELGLPLRFPLGQRAYDALIPITDAELLARATRWAADTPAAAGEIFNVHNGDYIRFRNLWPLVARDFGMEAAEPQPMSVAEHMADKGPVWDRLVARHGLVPTSWDSLVDWTFMDKAIGPGVEVIVSNIKLRQAGFGDCLDTEDSFLSWFGRLRAAKVLPPTEAGGAGT